MSASSGTYSRVLLNPKSANISTLFGERYEYTHEWDYSKSPRGLRTQRALCELCGFRKREKHTCELEDDDDEGDCHARYCAQHRRTSNDCINSRGDALVVPSTLCEETNIPYAVLQETEGKPEDSPDARTDAHGGNHVTPCSVKGLGFRL